MEERLARIEAWSQGHEERCEDRQVSMGREIREVKDGQKDMSADLKGLRNSAWGVVIALCAWALLQLYGNITKPAAAAPPAVAAAGSTP